MAEQMREIETYLTHAERRAEHLQHLFSEAIHAGDHDRALEINGQVHEAMLEREKLSEQLTAIRNAYG